MLWSYWKTDILMILIYSHSTCAVSKECVLKYDSNSLLIYLQYGRTWGTLSVKMYYKC